MLLGDLWALALRGNNADVHASWWLVIGANPRLGKAAKPAQAKYKPKQRAPPASVY